MDISGQESKTLDRYLDEPFDYVITVCDDANEACPFFPGAANRLHWSFEDPSRAEGSEEERALFRKVRDTLRGRIERELTNQIVVPDSGEPWRATFSERRAYELRRSHYPRPQAKRSRWGCAWRRARTCVDLPGLQERRAAPRKFVAFVKYVTRRSPPATVRARARSPCGRLTRGVQRHPRVYPSSTSTCRSINTWHGEPQKPSSRLWRAVYARSCKWTSENTLPRTPVNILSCTTRSSITAIVLPGLRWALYAWRPPPR